MRLQESGEMYLETILILSQKLEHVRSLDVAEHMGFSKPSVSRAVGLLKSAGYLLMDPTGYLTLTLHQRRHLRADQSFRAEGKVLRVWTAGSHGAAFSK